MDNNNQPTFTCIGRSHGTPVLPASRTEWEAMRNQPWLAEMCRRIEAGDEKLKRRLPVWTPHCAAFKNNHRAAADAKLPLQRLMLDFDEKGHSAEILARALELQKAGRWEILLVEESVRRGTHVLIRLPQGMTPQEAQAGFSADVGFQADGALKDVSRCIYMVPGDHTLYVDEENLFNEKSSVCEERRMKTIPQCKQSKNVLSEANEECPEKGGATEVQRFRVARNKKCNKCTKRCNKCTKKCNKCTKRCNKRNKGATEVQKRCNKGATKVQQRCNRPSRASLTRTSSNNGSSSPAANPHRAMPRYGLAEEEMKGLIHSACTAAWCGMPRMMQEALAHLIPTAPLNPSCGGTSDTAGNLSSPTGGVEGAVGLRGAPPAMPSVLPPLIALLVSRTPDIYKPAVAHAVFPPLAAHLHRVTFRYIDNVAHEATLMNVLMAGTGAGKDCISEPINRIMADIRKRDAKNLERERLWKQEVNSRGANKDKRQRPEGLVIQEIAADMTNPAFVMRTAEADGHFLYTKLNEIDQFDALRGSGKGGQQFQIMCLAFDPGNRYGQTRVGAQSVTEKVTVRFNWNAATTILKGKRYFSKVLTDGPISRINFCTIPEREIGADMPVYGAYDAAFDEELRPYIENLVHATGQVDCPEAYELAKKLCEENAEFSRLSQSRVYENLSFRANVIAYLKACVLYVAQGYKWDKPLEDFIRWSLQYDMWCKMEFFGDGIEQAMATPADNAHRPGRRNLLTLLPDEFTLQDAIRVRQAEGLDTQGASHMLSLWKSRGYISIISNLNYRKLKYRSDGIDLTKN